MAQITSIEWTDASWTPIRARNKVTGRVGWHCEHVTPGCEHCYAEGMNARLGTGLPFKPGHRDDIEIFLDETMLTAPLRWKRPRRVFVCSMTDLFAEFVPDEWIDRMFAVMALAPQHTFQVLTKRSTRMRKYFDGSVNQTRRSVINNDCFALSRSGGIKFTDEQCRVRRWPLPNVWLGVSCEDQERADERIPDLLATPAAVRFVSAEPLIGLIDFAPAADSTYQRLSEWYGPTGFDPTGSQPRQMRRNGWFPHIDWIICGGESGPGARPALAAWRRSIRDQCAAAGAAYFEKQWGEWIDADEWLRMMETPCNRVMAGERRLASPLTYEDAEILAGISNSRFEHQSDGSTMIRVGKHRAGRLLDGVEHSTFPEPRA